MIFFNGHRARKNIVFVDNGPKAHALSIVYRNVDEKGDDVIVVCVDNSK